jgi:hypothetical protein
MLSLLARLLDHERAILEDVGLLNSTIGAFLIEVGYHTAFAAGKWVNGDGCSSMTLAADGSPTWTSWAQLCNMYIRRFVYEISVGPS